MLNRYTISVNSFKYGIFKTPKEAEEALTKKGWEKRVDPLYNDWPYWSFHIPGKTAKISSICVPFPLDSL
jgi:hypothetical protein